MIEVIFKLETTPDGKIKMDSTAKGMGSVMETELAELVYEMGCKSYEVYVAMTGGKPKIIEGVHKVTEVGNG